MAPARPKKSNKKHGDQDGETSSDSVSSWLESMSLAKAVYHEDLEALTAILKSSLPNNVQSLTNVTMEKSVGEAFTGGRSTPVYYITAQVTTINTAGKSISKTRQFVVKLVLMFGSDTQAADSPKLQHKRESYAIERRFYQCVGSSAEFRSTLHIPKLLASDHNGSNPAHPVACWLMTDVRVHYPLHPTILDAKTHLRCALDWLAQFHAYFWNSSSSIGGGPDDWRRRLWERGGFWNKQRNHSSFSSGWLRTCQWLSKHHPDRLTADTKRLGGRFAALSEPLAEFMLAQSKASYSTMIHGDYKAANLFFRDSGKDDASAVAAVDFQFAGAGVPSEDMAYLLFPDALVDYWEDETTLLKHYHEQLMEALMLANKGGPSSFPLTVFMSLYRLSQLEMSFYWLQKGWVASTAGDAQLVTALEETMNQIDGGTPLASKEAYHQALENSVL